MSDDYETVSVERRGAALWLTLNRPRAMNAISLQLAADLHAVFDERYQDRSPQVMVMRRPDGPQPSMNPSTRAASAITAPTPRDA